MEYFVKPGSIVREIWGKSDTVLFIFAGAAAEFALNNAVDWLYFTGKLPADPLGRLFSTVSYASKIVFSPYDKAVTTIGGINHVHKVIEDKRGYDIPQWSYRDVLYMLIDYSIRSYELLQRKLSDQEKAEVYDVFYRVGKGMQIDDLPADFSAWLTDREFHLDHDLTYSKFTKDLFGQYKKHLGSLRYFLLTEVQKMLCPTRVKRLLGMSRYPLVWPLLKIYLFSRKFNLDQFLKALLLPPEYKEQISALDVK